MTSELHKKPIVVVAMSGGVDSSVAAALLKQQGYTVIGVTMQIWHNNARDNRVCCGIDAIEDAKLVAYKLGIPHYALDFREIFAQKVIADFCQEYRQGRTPNPCIRCNQYIKFDALLERARQLGAGFVATGHHARIESDKATGVYLLKKGVDKRKDQSYFLYMLTQEQLRHTLMPVGNITKVKVREIASEMGLKVANKPESQEICFIPDNDYARFLRDYIHLAAEPGPILDESGNVIGQHRGIPFYTIGQRKRLGIFAKQPLYVIGINPERNAIIVGNKECTYGNELIARELNWIMTEPPKQSISVNARIRHRHPEAEAGVIPLDEGEVRVIFKEPQMAITPGQAVVFYDGDTVIGGGTIKSAVSYESGKVKERMV